MDKQAVIDTLRDTLNDSEALEHKLRDLMRDQNMSFADAPYGMASALTRLESFRDDIQNAIDDIGGEL